MKKRQTVSNQFHLSDYNYSLLEQKGDENVFKFTGRNKISDELVKIIWTAEEINDKLGENVAYWVNDTKQKIEQTFASIDVAKQALASELAEDILKLIKDDKSLLYRLWKHNLSNLKKNNIEPEWVNLYTIEGWADLIRSVVEKLKEAWAREYVDLSDVLDWAKEILENNNKESYTISRTAMNNMWRTGVSNGEYIEIYAHQSIENKVV